MSLEKARKILKIVGILMIIGAVIMLAIGVLSLAGGGIGAASEDIQQDEELLTGAAALIIVGVMGIIDGIIKLIEGIVSVKASKNNKYGTAAWIFALLSLIGSVAENFSEIKASGITTTTVTSLIVGVGMSILILTAANTIRKAYKAER